MIKLMPADRAMSIHYMTETLCLPKACKIVGQGARQHTDQDSGVADE